MSHPLLEVEGLTIQYRLNQGNLTAVSDASFTLDEGEYFGLVGESGCGKTTLAESMLGALDENSHIATGKIRYKGEEIQDYSEREFRREIRWKEISYIPQSSMNSLDPFQKISEQAWEIAKVHTEMSKKEALSSLRDVFEVVGLQEERMADYPHQFSGGMQQRAIIALALFLEPSLIIADEPTTALDVIMQDQIFKHLESIQEELDVSMILITHDISLVFETCDHMAIMHSGQVAETGPTDDIFDNPRHPYSILLQDSFPDIRYPNRELVTMDGYPPQTKGEVDYCTFKDRCPWAVEECGERAPPLTAISNGGDHGAACFRKDEITELSDQK